MGSYKLFSIDWTYTRIKGDERLINRSVQALGSLIVTKLLNLGAHEQRALLHIQVSSPSETETAALSDTESVRHNLIQVHIETVVHRKGDDQGGPSYRHV